MRASEVSPRHSIVRHHRRGNAFLSGRLSATSATKELEGSFPYVLHSIQTFARGMARYRWFLINRACREGGIQYIEFGADFGTNSDAGLLVATSLLC